MLSPLAGLTIPAAVSLSVSVWATCVAPCVLVVDAERWAWPDLSRLLETSAADRVLVEVVRVKCTVRAAGVRARRIPRDTALTVAALLILTIPTGGRS